MFCDRMMSEPLHLEINIRQHMLDVLYKVAAVDSLSNLLMLWGVPQP